MMYYYKHHCFLLLYSKFKLVITCQLLSFTAPATEGFTCIAPETAPVRTSQVLEEEILQGRFPPLREAGQTQETLDSYRANQYDACCITETLSRLQYRSIQVVTILLR